MEGKELDHHFIILKISCWSTDRRASDQDEAPAVRVQRSTPDLLGGLGPLGHLALHGNERDHIEPH